MKKETIKKTAIDSLCEITGYQILIKPRYVVVGCQNIHNSIIRNLVKKIKNQKIVEPDFKGKNFSVKNDLFINPENIKTGTFFECFICSEKASGMIFNDISNKSLYFCQNSIAGDISPYRLGYKYSWGLCYNSLLSDESIKNMLFPKRPTNLKYPKISIIDYVASKKTKFYKNFVSFENYKIPNDLIIKLSKELID